MNLRYFIFTLLFFLLLLIPSTISFFSDTSLTKDSREYLHLSENLRHGVHYAGDLTETIDYRLFSKRPLGFATFINLSSPFSSVLLIICQMILLIVLFIIGLFIIREWKGDHKELMLIYTINFLLAGGLFLSSALVMADLLLSVLIALIVYLFLQYQKAKSRTILFSITVLWSIALLIKPIVLPSLLLIPIIWVLIKDKKFKLPLLFPLVVCLAIYYQNYRLSSVAHFSSISAINKVHYNSKLLISNNFGHDSAQLFTTNQALEIPRDQESFRSYLRYANYTTKEVLKNHLFSYFKLHIVGMLKSVVDPGRFELYTIAGQPTENTSLMEYLYAGEYQFILQKLKAGGIVFYLFLLLFFFSLLRAVCFFLGAWGNDKKQLFMLFVVLYFVGIAGPIGAFRFILPAVVPFLIISSIGLHRMLVFFKKRSKG